MYPKDPSADSHPHYVDVHVGHKIRKRRLDLSLDQATLAQCVGVSFQQIQKYERGTNRVSASRLYDIAQALGVDVHYFFCDLENCDPGKNAFIQEGILDFSKGEDGSIDPMKHAETLELAQAYLALPNGELRNSSLEFIRKMAGDEDYVKKGG